MSRIVLAAALAMLTAAAVTVAHDGPRVAAPGPPALPKVVPPGPYDGQPAATLLGDR